MHRKLDMSLLDTISTKKK